MNPRFVTLAAFAVSSLLICFEIPGAVANDTPAVDGATIWPQWRGPARDGFVAPGTKWPDRIDKESLKQVWRIELGPSYSGPVVAKDRIFVTETVKATNEVVRALDRRTGKEIWRAQWKGSMRVSFIASSNGSWIRATPAYDGESLFVAGMRDVLVCLDAKTGKERWRVDFMKKFNTPLPAFGFVSSPLVRGNAVYVQAGAAVRKLNKHTGEQIWASLSDGKDTYGSAFSSPVVATLAGKLQLLVQTRKKLAGVDLENGDVLWSEDIPAYRGMNILTPTVHGDCVFTTSYGGSALVLRVSQKDGKFKLDEVWNSNTQGYMSTPVLIDGHAYLHLKSRRFTCLDLSNGEKTWITTPYGKYWSLVANGDRILALDQRGELLLIRATPKKFDLLDTRKISDDSTWAHLAVCGNDILVRELNAIAVYRWDTAK